MQINLTTMNPRDFNERSQKNKRFINHDAYLYTYAFRKHTIRNYLESQWKYWYPYRIPCTI